MPARLRESGQLVRQTARDFADDDCMSMAAALAYYTVFSLPPLLVVIVTVAGFVWGPEAVQGAIEEEISGMVGAGGRQQVHEMMVQARQQERGTIAAVVGAVVLLVGATGVFLQLQHSLNKTWSVAPDPEQGGVKNFITRRLLSLGMVLAIAFLLLVSLAATTALTAAGDAFGGMLPGGVPALVPTAISIGVAFIVIWLLFAAMFRFLPDAQIAWRDVWIGGAITALLFVVGKTLIGWYLGTLDPGAYGPAGSLVLILLWIYYSALILLFGAEFTQSWARRSGREIEPKAGAVRIAKKTVPARQGAA